MGVGREGGRGGATAVAKTRTSAAVPVRRAAAEQFGGEKTRELCVVRAESTMRAWGVGREGKEKIKGRGGVSYGPTTEKNL